MTWFLVEKSNPKVAIAQADNKGFLETQLNINTQILSQDEFMAYYIPPEPVAADEQPVSEGLDTIEPAPTTEP